MLGCVGLIVGLIVGLCYFGVPQHSTRITVQHELVLLNHWMLSFRFMLCVEYVSIYTFVCDHQIYFLFSIFKLNLFIKFGCKNMQERIYENKHRMHVGQCVVVVLMCYSISWFFGFQWLCH